MSAVPPSASRRRDWTILEVLGWTTQRFAERNLRSPRLDAELLIAHALGARRIDLYVGAERLLTAEQLAQIREVVRRRQEGESVAYITGEKEFWGLPFRVNRHVLVPRPDTETLVEAALDRIGKLSTTRVVDVGTGSGAIAVAIAKSRPNAVVFATDRSSEALAVARDNATRNGVQISFFEGHLLEPILEEPSFDLIIANLPYIPSADIAGLEPEVRGEPLGALDGGPDGLDIIRELIAAAPTKLNSGGSLLLELGEGQAQTVVSLMINGGLHTAAVVADLAGIDRVVAAQWGTARTPDPDLLQGTTTT